MKNIIISGGTGLIGKMIINSLPNHNFYILSRTKSGSQGNINFINYEIDVLKEIVLKSDVIINLAGAPIAGKRWSNEYKKELYDSRINTTKILVDAVNLSGKNNIHFISASATGYYGSRGDEVLKEDSAPGNDFLSTLCKDWESATEELKCSLSLVRIGIVLSKKGGALEKILPPFRFFLGGRLGKGNNYWPWIHYKDLVRIFLYLINNKSDGIFNASAPEPVSNITFSKSLGKVLRKPSVIPVPYFALKIFLGEFADFLVSSQRTIPQNLLNSGFKFEFKTIDKCLKDLFYE